MAARVRTNRLEAFSDGVFAIAITILVLEIAVPEGSGDDLLQAFFNQWPSYLAYLVSFSTIGVTWIRHTAITHYLEYIDATLVRLNLLLLLLVSFLPFPTALVADHVRDADAERVATTILGINLLLVAVVVSALWRYALGRGLVRADAGDDDVATVTRRVVPSLAGYALVILFGFVLPLVAVWGYLAIALFLLIPAGLRHWRA